MAEDKDRDLKNIVDVRETPVYFKTFYCTKTLNQKSFFSVFVFLLFHFSLFFVFLLFLWALQFLQPQNVI